MTAAATTTATATSGEGAAGVCVTGHVEDPLCALVRVFSKPLPQRRDRRRRSARGARGGGGAGGQGETGGHVDRGRSGPEYAPDLVPTCYTRVHEGAEGMEGAEVG